MRSCRASDLTNEAIHLVEHHVALVGAPLGIGFLSEDRGQIELFEEQEPKVS